VSAVLDLYAKLTETSDDKERARLIVDAIEALEARFPHLNDLATQGDVRESELRLQREIKGVELQIREVEGRLQKEIKEVESRLQKEIKAVELKISQVEVRIREVEVNLHKAMAAQTRWLLGGLAVLGAVFKLADLLLGP
jgi:peptidoglycan hydrolase CwlO-like protein